jgi:hypothetical protein
MIKIKTTTERLESKGRLVLARQFYIYRSF